VRFTSVLAENGSPGLAELEVFESIGVRSIDQ
jgi:hypothetical protein